MIASTANILLAGSVLLLISIVAGKTSSRFGVPTLLFFLIVGVLAGSEGIGGIYFDNPHITEFIGVVALNFILFSGGLDTDWKHIKPILWRGVALSTIGVFLTAFSVGLFVHYALGFSLVEGLLLGSHCICHRCSRGFFHPAQQGDTAQRIYRGSAGTGKRKQRSYGVFPYRFAYRHHRHRASGCDAVNHHFFERIYHWRRGWVCHGKIQ
jgi:hypothetical protein